MAESLLSLEACLSRVSVAPLPTLLKLGTMHSAGGTAVDQVGKALTAFYVGLPSVEMADPQIGRDPISIYPLESAV